MMASRLRRDPSVVSKSMKRVKATGTNPEIALRRALWRRGQRYRVQPPLLGKPDVAFLGKRTAVFVDGDFWHGRQWMTRGFASIEDQMLNLSHGDYWVKKIRRNVERDHRVTAELRENGWHVIRLWATDVERDPEAAADAVITELERA